VLLQSRYLLLQKLVQFAQRLAARRRQARLFLGSLPMHLDRGDAVGHFVTCHSYAHTDSSLCFLLGVALKRCDGAQCQLAACGLRCARCGTVPLQRAAKGCTPRRADASLGAGSGAAPRAATMRPTDESYYTRSPVRAAAFDRSQTSSGLLHLTGAKRLKRDGQFLDLSGARR
jgi:hypothetical protein